jgi:hypothetical protein
MKRIVRLTESDLIKLVKRVINEQTENTNKTFDEISLSLLKSYGLTVNPQKTEAKAYAPAKYQPNLVEVKISKVPCRIEEGSNMYVSIDIYVNQQKINKGKECPDACWGILKDAMGIGLSQNKKIDYISLPKKKKFDNFALDKLKRFGFKFNPDKNIATLGKIEVKVSNVVCQSDMEGGTYQSIEIRVNGVLENKGKECPDACWVILDNILSERPEEAGF